VRRDVLSQLPSRTDTRVPVEMTPAQQVEHEELRPAIARLLSIAARRALTHGEFLRLMQLLTTQRIICNGLAQLRFDDEWPRCNQAPRPTPALLESLCAPKLSVLRGLVEEVVLGQGRKAVVFSQWRSMLRLSEWAVRDLLAAAGQRAVFFTGAESNKLRERAIIELHDDPATTLMFLSDAGGVGLNLQRAATCCINLELPWNPAVLEQRIGRIYRMGQRRPIDVYTLVSEPGIESRIAELVGAKRALFAGLFDGTGDEVVFERAGSFMSRVERLVTPATGPAAVPAGDPSPAEEDGTDREIEATMVAADESRDAVDAAVAEVAAPPPSADDIQRLFSGLSVQRTAEGGLVIEAPPAAASALAALLSGMAGLLQGKPGVAP
jgi:hypothetical protein